MGRRIMLALAALLGLSSPGRAAEPSIDQVFDGQIPDIVQTLVVQAITPGPAWWKVTKGESTLWIFGVPPYLSGRDDWDRSALQRRLKGARAFIPPIYMQPQPYFWGRGSEIDPNHDGLPPPRTIDLSPDLRARLKRQVDDRNILTIIPNSSVVFATRMINLQLMRQAALADGAMAEVFETEARQAGVKIEALPRNAVVAANRLAVAYASGAAGPKSECLEKTLDVAESGPNPLRSAYEAWAGGDVPNALATIGCVGVKGAVYKQEVAYLIPILRRHLAEPGKTVVAVELTPLLMKDGLIERLGAMGYAIVQPDSLKDPA